MEAVDPRYAFGVGERDLVVQADRVVGVGELRMQCSVECIDRRRDPVKPCAVPSWCGRGEGVFENVQSMQGSLALGADVCCKRFVCAARSRRLGFH